ncbi:hypothetical protein [Swingsia samuiensis]|uniref:DUF2125 domain-containing protein n=1 Tax=Swingsia samuiensis TaxID=1293412 RepID=A0A4Y6UIU8_9PROT|nr:hypothetical protein [Swingsia samuiensis]QDH16396.1 hypothetical protein E3D00_01550 [Swingsia samuiensis]
MKKITSLFAKTITQHRKKLRLFSICLVALLGIDTAAWLLTTSHLKKETIHFLNNIDSDGYNVSFSHINAKGWPFGAWVELTAPHIKHIHSPNIPLDIGWQGDTVQIGGAWPSLITSTLHIHFNKRHALRFISGDNQLTLVLDTLNLKYSRANTDILFNIHSLEGSFYSPSLEQRFLSHHLFGRIIIPYNVKPGQTRVGANLYASNTLLPIINKTSVELENTHLSIALSASNIDAPLFNPDAFKRLFIQDFSTSFANLPSSARIKTAGVLSYPQCNGSLFVTLLNWQAMAHKALTLPVLQSSISPDLQSIIQKMLHTQPSYSISNAPLTVEIPLQNHSFPPEIINLFRLISSKKIDVLYQPE